MPYQEPRYHPAAPTPTAPAIPKTMRALVLDGTGFANLKIREIPVARPGPNQLLARVDAAGICTSLIKLVEQGPSHKYLYGWDIDKNPLILGDEGSITLVEVGSALQDRYQIGQRFVTQSAVRHPPINHLDRYRDNGRGVDFVACGYTLPGHLAEYILIPEEVLAGESLVPVPDASLPYAHAAMGEPFGCIIASQDHHAHLTQAGMMEPRQVIKGLKPGGVTVLVGAGAMGRMQIDLAFSYRPRAVIVTGHHDDRLERVTRFYSKRAEALGIPLHVINTHQTDPMPLINELTDHIGADDVIISVGSRQAIEEAQQYVGRGGVLNLFGGLKKGEDIVDMDTGMIHYKEVFVTGSSGGTPWDIARTLELMAKGEIDAAPHVTRIGDLEHAAQFLEMVKARQIDGKAVVYPHRRTERILSVDSWTAEDEKRYLAG